MSPGNLPGTPPRTLLCFSPWTELSTLDSLLRKQNAPTLLFVKSSTTSSGSPLQYPCLENPMGGGAWWAAVHGVAESQTRLSDFTCTFHFHALEKEMATHSSILAWRIPGMGEPGGLPSMGPHRVGHDWSDLAAAAAAPPTSPCSLLEFSALLIQCTLHNCLPSRGELPKLALLSEGE